MVKCDIPKYRLENWKIRYNFLYVNSESGVVIFTNSASLAVCLPQLKVRFDVGIFASRSPYWRHVFFISAGLPRNLSVQLPFLLEKRVLVIQNFVSNFARITFCYL